MKILIPAKTSADSFTDNVSVTLREMGHDVRTLGERTSGGRPALRSRVAGRAVNALKLRRHPLRHRRILRVAGEFRPDLVLALTQELDEETLHQLRRLGSRCVAWWADAPANLVGASLYSAYWDVVFLKDVDAVRKLACAGVNAMLLHEAMNPIWHRPKPSKQNDSVAVVGNFYRYRANLVQRLQNDGVPLRLHGIRPTLGLGPELRRLAVGPPVYRQQKAEVFASAAASLNSMSLREGNSLNCRAFEIAGSGGLQVIEARPAIEECFAPGKELLVYSTYEELMSHIEFSRKAPAEARRIREAGTRRAHENHTYRHRLALLMGVIGQV